MRLASYEQETLEIEALRLQAPFPISDGLLREMVRRSNPSKVTIALRECSVRYDEAQRRWSPSLCRRMVVRVWKKVSGQSAPDAVAGASAPASRTAKEPMRLSKKEACALLHISESTLLRRMKAGRYKFSKVGEGQYAKLSFTYAGIGLTEPIPEVIPLAVSHAPAPVPEPVQEPEPEPSQVGPARTYATGWNADRSMFVSSEGVIYRRHPSGEMYRSDERLNRVPSTSPHAVDSVIRYGIQRSNVKEQLGAGAGKAGTVDDPAWKARFFS